MGSKGRPYRSVDVEGFTVLVGKSDDANDDLTFKVADKQDVWLHVAGCPGSHVVVRNPDRLADVPRDVLEAAAGLAAWYSKARGAPRVEVHYCRVSDVSKAKRAPAGQVQLKRYKTVKVQPANIGGDDE